MTSDDEINSRLNQWRLPERAIQFQLVKYNLSG